MKKYQNWLDFQLYNNHLHNLVQIKKRKSQFQVNHQTAYPKHTSHHGFTIYSQERAQLRPKNGLSFCKSYFINK